MRRADKILAILADGVPRRAGDIARAVGASKVSHLLAEMIAAGSLCRVAHGLYQRTVEGEPPQEEPSGPPLRIHLLFLIAALGRARSKDLTLLTGIGRHRSRGARIANHMARLKALHLIMPDGEPGKQPTYSLTDAGMQLVQGQPKQWDRFEPMVLRAQLDEALRAFSAEASKRLRAPHGTFTKIRDHIRKLLAKGPKSTTELIAAQPELFTTPTIIHIALRSLTETGEIIQIGEASGCRPARWARRLQPVERHK